jgi:hypothetical protein
MRIHKTLAKDFLQFTSFGGYHNPAGEYLECLAENPPYGQAQYIGGKNHPEGT